MIDSKSSLLPILSVIYTLLVEVTYNSLGK